MGLFKVIALLGLIVLFVAAAGCGGGDGEEDAQQSDLPVTDVSPEAVLGSGTAVDWTLCAELANWERKPIGEMVEAFGHMAYGDGDRPAPLLYVPYVSNFFYLPLPMAHLFGGSQSTELERISELGGLNWPEAGAEYAKFCGAESGYVMPPRLEILKVAGYHVLDMKRDDSDLVVLVREQAGVWEEAFIALPAPSDPSLVASEFETVHIVDEAGTLLFEQRLVRPYSGYQKMAYEDGGPSVGVIAGRPPLLTAPFAASGEELHVYGDAGGGTISAGRLTVMDSTGQEVLEHEWQAEEDYWSPLASLQLAPGAYTIRFEMETRNFRHFVLLPASTALP